MADNRRNIIFRVIFFLALFYVVYSYQLNGSFVSNIFYPGYYTSSTIVYKLLFSFAVVCIALLFCLFLRCKRLRDIKILNILYNEKAFLFFYVFGLFLRCFSYYCPKGTTKPLFLLEIPFRVITLEIVLCKSWV